MWAVGWVPDAHAMRGRRGLPTHANDVPAQSMHLYRRDIISPRSAGCTLADCGGVMIVHACFCSTRVCSSLCSTTDTNLSSPLSRVAIIDALFGLATAIALDVDCWGRAAGTGKHQVAVRPGGRNHVGFGGNTATDVRSNHMLSQC